MGLFSINPLATQGLDLSTRGGQDAYKTQIANCLQQLQMVVSQLAGAGTLSGPALNDFGTITTNQTVNVGGAKSTFLRFTSGITQTITITLTAFPQSGIIMIVAVVTAGTLTMKLAATDTSGNAYAITGFGTISGGSVDVVGTGVATAVTAPFFGMSGFAGTSATPVMALIFT